MSVDDLLIQKYFIRKVENHTFVFPSCLVLAFRRIYNYWMSSIDLSFFYGNKGWLIYPFSLNLHFCSLFWTGRKLLHVLFSFMKMI